MLDKTSRYVSLETALWEEPRADGSVRPVRYLRRRFLPPPPPAETTFPYRTVHGDRLDLIARRYAGDPLQFWRIADANRARRPRELTDRPGTVIRIPVV